MIFIQCTKDPVARFYMEFMDQSYNSVTIRNLSRNAERFIWDFGDGNSTITYSTQQTVQHTYPMVGVYTVKLIAINSKGVESIDMQDVKVSYIPGGSGGSGGSGSTTPTSMKLTGIKLNKYPTTDQDGDNWDWTDAGPDIYYKIYDGSSLMYTSSTKSNVDYSDLPISWNISNVYWVPSKKYTVKFYDEDGALDSDDLMTTVSFTPNQDFPYNNTGQTYYWSNEKWNCTFYYQWIY